MNASKSVKRHRDSPMSTVMSDVEALLSVDAGQIPPGTLAFFRKGAGSPILRARALLAGALGVTAMVMVLAGGNKAVATLLLLAAALMAVLATPTIAADEEDGDQEGERAICQPVMVVTPQGLIGRDERGLRSWRFDDLSSVFTGGQAERPQLVLVERDGTRHAIDDYLRYADGERLREVIDARLRRS